MTTLPSTLGFASGVVGLSCSEVAGSTVVLAAGAQAAAMAARIVNEAVLNHSRRVSVPIFSFLHFIHFSPKPGYPSFGMVLGIPARSHARDELPFFGKEAIDNGVPDQVF
jgi:hypothetical protein